MDNKQIVTNVGIALISAALVGGGTWLATRVDKGGDAIDKLARQAEMTAAIEEALKTPEGETYGAVLSRIDRDMTVMKRTIPLLLGVPPEPETP